MNSGSLFRSLWKISLAALLLIHFQSNAQIASWTYEPLQGSLNNPAPNSGTGSSAIVNNGGGSIVPGVRTGMDGTGCGAQVSGQSAWALEPFDPGSSNESNGARFSASTVGYQNINFSWDQRWSNTAPNTVRLQYTLNGSTWTNFTMTAATTSFCLGSLNAGRFQTNTTGDQYRRLNVNLSGIAGANNNPNFGVRLVAAYYQGTGQFRRTDDPTQIASTAGTWRFDNVSFSGTLLPGPTASVISGTTATCAGNAVNIKVAITGGTGPFTVVVSDGSGNFTVSNYTSNANISVTPAITTTYTIVSVTNANGVAGTGNSGSATVTINPLPTVTAGNITSCSAGAVTLNTGSPAGGTYSIPNPYSGPSTTFTYTYTDANGCSNTSATYSFTRNTAPSITAQPSPGSQTSCAGTAFPALTVVATGTNLTYQWYSNATASTTGGTPLLGAADIASGSQSSSFTPSTASVGTLYYYATVSGSCTPSVKTAVSGSHTVLTATVAGTASASQSICAGMPVADLSLSGQTGSIIKWQKADDSAFSVNLTDIAVTSATLSSATIGLLTHTTYFRAVVQSAGCAVQYTPGIVIDIPTTTWNGSAWSNGTPDGSKSIIFDGNYTSSGNLTGCAAVVSSGIVDFLPGHDLELLNGLNVTGGSITFENNASLVQWNNAVNSGSIYYKRDTTPIRKYDYTYWSSPVANELLINVSPLTRQDKFFWFDANSYNWVMANPNTTIMQPGIGYIFRGPDDYDATFPVVYHATFSGVPNNGDYSVPVFVAGANDFNLLGNPYPSAISADLFLSDPENAAALGTGTTLYFWTHNTPVTGLQYIFSDYATYNYTGGTGTSASPGPNSTVPNGYIAAGQSFFIQGIATGTAKFKNSMRSLGNNDSFFRMQNMEKDRFWLEMTNAQGQYKQLLVGYVPNATDGYDQGYDGIALNGENTASIYTLLQDKHLTIQGRALPFSDQDVVPLGFTTNVAGAFTIGMMRTEGLFDVQDIFLEDQALGIVHNLKTADYTFTSAAGIYDGRFLLRYTAALLTAPTLQEDATDLIVFGDNVGVKIESRAGLLDEVCLYDMTGRKLIEVRNIRSESLSIPFERSRQTLIATVKTADGRSFNRKIIR